MGHDFLFIINSQKSFPEGLKLLWLQRAAQNHTKPYEFRMGCHTSSYLCKGRQGNAFGNIVYLDIYSIKKKSASFKADRQLRAHF